MNYAKLVRQNVAEGTGYIPGEQPTDAQTIKLNTNENPYPPSPRVMQAITSVTPEQLRRYPNPSARPFREAAARVHNLSPDWILTFNGGDELLATVIRACATESDRIAFLEPSYSLYPVLTAMQGAKPIELSYHIDATQWSLPEKIADTDAALMLIVNPNAPSGTLDSPETLAAIAEKFRGVLVIDEAYVDFAPRSALDLVTRFPNVLLLRTMSKGYGLAGIRFGYAIAQPGLLKELEKVRDSYPCDAVSIAAATAAIEDQTYAQSTWEKVKAERTRLTGLLRSLGFVMPDSHSNFILAQVPAAQDARQTYEYLKSKGILVRYFDLPRLTDKLRITVGTPEQSDRLIAQLRNIR